MTELIEGWECQALANGERQALGPIDSDGDRSAMAWLRPTGALEVLFGTVIPPLVLRWLVRELPGVGR